MRPVAGASQVGQRPRHYESEVPSLMLGTGCGRVWGKAAWLQVGHLKGVGSPFPGVRREGPSGQAWAAQAGGQGRLTGVLMDKLGGCGQSWVEGLVAAGVPWWMSAATHPQGHISGW